MDEMNTKRQGIRNLVVMSVVVAILTLLLVVGKQTRIIFRQPNVKSTKEDVMIENSCTEEISQNDSSDFSGVEGRIRAAKYASTYTDRSENYEVIEEEDTYTILGEYKPTFYEYSEIVKLAKGEKIQSTSKSTEHMVEKAYNHNKYEGLKGAVALEHRKVKKKTVIRGTCNLDVGDSTEHHVVLWYDQKFFVLPPNSKFEFEVTNGDIYLCVIGNNISADVISQIEENLDLEAVVNEE